MNSPNEDGKQPEKTESPKQQGSACCGPGCGCGTAAKPNKARWVVGVIVLAAAGVLVVKGMVKSDKGATQAPAEGFANPAAAQVTAGADTKAEAAAADETTVGTTLGAFAELNTAAKDTVAEVVKQALRESARAARQQRQPAAPPCRGPFSRTARARPSRSLR